MKIAHYLAILVVLSCVIVGVVLNKNGIGASREQVARGHLATSLEARGVGGDLDAKRARFNSCKKHARDYLRRGLKDYKSARIDWKSTELAEGMFPIYGGDDLWSVSYLVVMINAKNSMGAYIGWKRWCFGWQGEGEVFLVFSTDGGKEWMFI